MNMTIQNDNRRFLSKKAIENIEDIEDVKNLLLHIRDNNYSNVILHACSIKNDLQDNFCVKLHIKFFDVGGDQQQTYWQNYFFITVFHDANIANTIHILLNQIRYK